jgi:hypothetical protein
MSKDIHWSRVRRTVLYLSVAILGVNAVRLGVDKVRAQAPPTIPAGAVVTPYTAVLSEVVIGASGKTRMGPSQTWAMRSDGATVLKIGEGEKSTRLVRFPDGTRVEVSDALRGKTTLYKPFDRAWLRDPQTNCATPLGRDTSDGHESKALSDSVQGNRAARISRGSGTYWYALDAGCALIKRSLRFDGGGFSNLELVSLIRGEPSAGLFATPEDYREVAPSTFIEPPAQCDTSCVDARRRLIERLDETYRIYGVR